MSAVNDSVPGSLAPPTVTLCLACFESSGILGGTEKREWDKRQPLTQQLAPRPPLTAAVSSAVPSESPSSLARVLGAYYLPTQSLIREDLSS